MKKILFTLCLALTSLGAFAQNQNFEVKGNSIVVAQSTNQSNAEETDMKYVDSKGVEYQIWISASGSCFVIKTSKKTGKEYRQYLGEDISRAVCKKLKREYKGKTKDSK